ncbi:ankyrin repeat [Paramyrothecium foliicola]|nr:ankyrin repeat [Paramyrothecium foliicola]
MPNLAMDNSTASKRKRSIDHGDENPAREWKKQAAERSSNEAESTNGDSKAPKRRRSVDHDEEPTPRESKKRKADSPPASTELTHHDYTVGWVCALPKEQTAATAMLDQRHVDLPKPSHDQNTYTLGAIGGHNIVIACLPKGKIGTISAATVSTWMISTFPSIKFGLMVGIGGGIPPKVRLGDVVVSTPVNQFPGVVQWDSGKAKDGGQFERIGALDNPPTSLLTALTKLETAHELSGSRIPEHLEELKQRWPRLAPKYLKTDSLEDVLFKPDYSHVEEDATQATTEDDERESCRLCDRGKTVKRKPRDMRVHFGLIASGNQVIKDAAFRDNLNKTLGGGILCIEMEAAGLLHNFPCIVIRGICDYADSHKNKDWQEHAAAVAAAFTKELLQYVQVSDVDGERTAKDTLSKVGLNVAKIQSKMDREEEGKILNWLTQADYGPQQTDFINRRQENTGQWFLKSTEYQKWLENKQQTLFCPGNPGVGKTILSSIVIDDLNSRFSQDEKIGIAYIFCNFRRRDEQKPENLLASLLKQLGQAISPLPPCLKLLFNQHRDKGTRPSLKDITKALQNLADLYSRVFIIIDALDECQSSGGFRSKILSDIFSLQAHVGVNFLATSRPIPDIEGYFKQCLRIEIVARDEDIRRYIRGHMSHLPKFILNRPDIQEEIISEVAMAVEGMFLLAQLYVDSLTDKTSVTELKCALKKFQKQRSRESGEDGMHHLLNQAYEQAVERIDGQMPGFRLLGRRVLSWICCARRPLTTSELQHALAIKAKDAELDRDNLREIEDVSVCCGLVTVDEESKILRLVHYTAQNYFDQAQNSWLRDAETEITTACVTYLSFDMFATGLCKTDKAFEQRLEDNPLYDYAARNWGNHARRASKDVNQMIMDLLAIEGKVLASSQAMLASKAFGGDSSYSQRVPGQMTCAHLAAWFGLADIIQSLKARCDLDSPNSEGRTPLSFAAEHGHETAVAAILSEDGVVINAVDSRSNRTPLSWASGNGHSAVVKLLLAQENIKPNLEDRDALTPLSWAALGGHDGVVQLLLANDGVFPDSKAKWIYRARTPLSLAAIGGHGAVVELLLRTGKVDPDYKDDGGQTPLSHAAHQGSEESVKALLATKNIAIDSLDHRGFTPLWLAMIHGKVSIAKLLLGHGANPNYMAVLNQTPLHLAVQDGNKAVVALLLDEERTDVNGKDGDSWTPLMQAVKKGNETLVKLLIGKEKVDVNIEDASGRTALSLAFELQHYAVVELLLGREDIDIGAAGQFNGMDDGTRLHWAAKTGHEAIAKLLLERGADVEAKNGSNVTPLWMAVEEGHEAVVKVLLDGGADPNARDINRRILLLRAARCGQEPVVKLLLEKGANIDASDKHGQTALRLAIKGSHEKVVKTLLENGADFEARDDIGRTLLHVAALRGNTAIVKDLLDQGLDIETQDIFHLTPLIVAVERDRFEVVKLLLKMGANVEARVSGDKTALLYAVCNNNATMVEVLLENGADIEAKDSRYGLTPLLWAVNNDFDFLARVLLEKRPNLEAEDKQGLTALSLATLRRLAKVVELLLERGAKVDAKDCHGVTPLWFAVYNKDAASLELLINHGADTKVTDHVGRLPVEWAATKRFQEILELLPMGRYYYMKR